MVNLDRSNGNASRTPRNEQRASREVTPRSKSTHAERSRSSHAEKVNRVEKSPREEPVADRPPPLPARIKTNSAGGPRRSRRREHSLPRKADVMPTVNQEVPLLNSEVRHGEARRHSNPSDVLHQIKNPDGSPVKKNLYQNLQPSSHSTHFTTVGDMKVRVSKSPLISRNPNTVGRAEHLLNNPNSGLKSPVASRNSEPLTPSSAASVCRENNDQVDEMKYLDAVARASLQKYGGHNSIDRRWAKYQREVSAESQDTVFLNGSVSSPTTPKPYRSTHNYVNLAPPVVRHERQRSADAAVLGGHENPSPVVVRHSRQRSAEEFSPSTSVNFDPMSPPPTTDHRHGHFSKPQSRQNSLTSHSSTLSRGKGDKKSYKSQISEGSNSGRESARNSNSAPVVDWLKTASCEDLSDHMRTAIYDDDGNEASQEKQETDLYTVLDHGSKTKVTSATEDNKPPLPFVGLKNFEDKTVDADSHRDRSRSFGYVNVKGNSPQTHHKPISHAPSAHLIRKMVNARAKQENLRKSLSNPNFLNLGSKEQLADLKPHTSPSPGGKFTAALKQKSRSFGSLFPAIKRAFSRESLGSHSRSTTPERRSSFCSKRRNSNAESNFRRSSSSHSLGEITVKGVRFTERSRSFRKVRGAKSVETLRSESRDKPGDNRLSTVTNLSQFSNDTRISSDTKVSTDTYKSTNTHNSSDSRPPSRKQSIDSTPTKLPSSRSSHESSTPSQSNRTQSNQTQSSPVQLRKKSQPETPVANNPGYLCMPYMVSADLSSSKDSNQSKPSWSSSRLKTDPHQSKTSLSSRSSSSQSSIGSSSAPKSGVSRTSLPHADKDPTDENSNKFYVNNFQSQRESSQSCEDLLSADPSNDNSENPKAKKKRPKVSDMVKKIELDNKGDPTDISSATSKALPQMPIAKPFDPIPFKKLDSKPRSSVRESTA